MVAIGRALMSQPEILMLDEPSLGLSPVLTKELFRSLAKIAETGVGILLVEQNARQSLKIAQPRLPDRGRPHHRRGPAQSLMTRSGGGQCLSRRRRDAVGEPVRLPAPFRAAGRPRVIRASDRGLGVARRRDPGGLRARAAPGSRRCRAPSSGATIRRKRPIRGTSSLQIPRATVPSKRVKASQDGKSTCRAVGRSRASRRASSRPAHPRLRASRENPSAFAGRYDPATALIEIDEVSPASLARSAADRMAEHVRRQRLARPMPSAFAMPGRSDPVPETSPASRPALGHNSRGVDIEAEERQEAATACQA